MKDLRVLIREKTKEVVFQSPREELIVSFDELEKNPSGVFRRLVEMLMERNS